MAEAVLLELVEAHLDDELRPERLSARARPCPSGWARRSGGRCSCRAAAARARRSRRAASRRLRRADVVEVPVVGVEAEQQRRDRRPAALLAAHAGDDAVGGLVRLHLDDAVARARQVRKPELLRDHAVEARSLQRLEPRAPFLDIRGSRAKAQSRRPASRAARGASRSAARVPASPSTTAGRRRRTSLGSRRTASGPGSRPDGAASASRRSRACRRARSRSRRRARSAAAGARHLAQLGEVAQQRPAVA